ncbi:NAD(P)H-hydrate dehydratase [Vibrio rarus]|uniref:NAD(P)H-hydrate dehydratase n=1 Tax=Vibrio rarus TaxID=413403 RepID=UPI0021C44BA3|nr:NAD(P)H-hydrate dehydratase [Vibrio rarus]
MRNLYSSHQIRQSEENVARLANISLYELMQRAGSAAFEQVRRILPEQGKLLVCCGSGNNGGDGFVVATLALELGYEVDVLQSSGSPSTTLEAIQAQQQWRTYNRPLLNEIESDSHYDLIVDALLGTGLTGVVRPSLAKVIQTINDLKIPVLSLDIPSGLNADTGTILGVAVQASTTVTFIGNKKGLVTGKACDVVGELYLAELGVQQHFYSLEKAYAHIFDRDSAYKALPKRQHSSHKGHCGRALFIGGNQGKSGAIILASQACARIGAGLINVATHQQSVQGILSRQPEVMTIAVSSDAEDIKVTEAMGLATAIGLGPGLGCDPWAFALFEQAMRQHCPKVIDADGLNLLAQTNVIYDLHNCILTPHPGEASRLLGVSIADIEHDRYTAIRQLQSKYQCVVLLKGAGTLIADGSNTWVIHAGNSGMATGGMGDVLTGVILGLLCQGMPVVSATCLGAWLHSTAADLNGQQFGSVGMLASDLLPILRQLRNDPFYSPISS